MSSNFETSEGEDSPVSRRGRSSSMVSTSSLTSLKSKQGGSKALRKSSSLPGETVEYLKAWMMSPDHVAHPYPTEQEKLLIMEETGIELKQLTNWFVNNRKRYWKPRVEARLQQHVVATVTTAPLVAQTAQRQAVAATHSNESSSLPTSHPFVPAAPTYVPEPALTCVPVTNYSLRPVSDSSSGSDSGNMSDSNSTAGESTVSEELDQDSGIVVRSENVDVHILRPIGFLGKPNDKPPTIDDVTILPDVPASRIIRSFRNITMMYHYSKEIAGDRKKIQARRETEVVRIKKQYLMQHLSDCSASDLLAMRTSPVKRTRSDDFEDVVVRRRKYSEASPSLFREACTTASHVYDIGLPSLEEATALFGYAQ